MVKYNKFGQYNTQSIKLFHTRKTDLVNHIEDTTAVNHVNQCNNTNRCNRFCNETVAVVYGRNEIDTQPILNDEIM